jgi:uncharacterized FAD-dependent dehydrogenase
VGKKKNPLKQIIDLSVAPETAAAPEALKQAAADALHLPAGAITALQIVRRSIDARHGRPQYQLKLEVYTPPHRPAEEEAATGARWPPLRQGGDVIIVGAGPAGLFAALKLREYGLRPVILERGKNVSARKYDIAQLTREHRVDPNSNWCFGEGGAGTFTDGKLYTRSHKRGNVQAVLQTLVAHGASPDILVDAHAHIGTDRLPNIIANLRKTIEAGGGEYHFETRVVDLIVNNRTVAGVVDERGVRYEGRAVVLATGHSAHDVYEWFDRRGWALEAKPFAMGVRVEHPQALINEIQYGRHYSRTVRGGERGEALLPPATYRLAAQVDRRGVFSFCMCPGGIMVPATTAAGSVVINGMSNSQRNSPYANSGIVVQVFPADAVAWASHGALAGLRLQQQTEQAMGSAAGQSQAAPAQRLVDFLAGRDSSTLLKTSYLAGATAAPLHELLPPFIVDSLQRAFREFGRKMHGYLSAEAMLVAAESRTSSPARIPRDEETLQHIQLARLYPCGEGAGYAGGITSSAIDGMRCAEAVAVGSSSWP